MNIFKQVNIVTSPFNEKMFIESLQKQLSSNIFRELIQKEKEGIKITVTMEVGEFNNDNNSQMS